MERLFFLIIGLGGLAILLWLGTWQVQRLGWKETLLADMQTRITAEPVALPDMLDRERDRYLPVKAEGRFITGPETGPVRMLASRRQIGAVYRHIAVFEQTNGRRILVDLGWTPADTPLEALPSDTLTVTGNLDWPRETDGFTPEPDLSAGLWYARDVGPLSAALGTAPILMVLSQPAAPELNATPWPVDTSNIPNDHLQYAITWFSLAAIWVAMTLYFMRRKGRRDQEG